MDKPLLTKSLVSPSRLLVTRLVTRPRAEGGVAAVPDEPPRPHRPVPLADLAALVDGLSTAAGADSRAEVAAATAALVVAAGRGELADSGEHTDRLVSLSELVGMDVLAALWRDSDPVSLPGALWVLYVLREWCSTRSFEVARLWRAGEPYAPADAVVAGVGAFGDADDLQRLADAVLAGAYGGDFGVALERAAAFFRVIAAGRRQDFDAADGHDDEHNPDIGERDGGLDNAQLADRNERTAADLSTAARAWRAGTLR
jgi:hypothetical protein